MEHVAYCDHCQQLRLDPALTITFHHEGRSVTFCSRCVDQLAQQETGLVIVFREVGRADEHADVSVQAHQVH